MLTKLQTFREENEDAFTLIELLVVILIIGILSSIAIPVFLNQRKTANDAAVESDVKNAATAVESWIVGQKGADNYIPNLDTLDAKKSEGVNWTVTGSANGYCILGTHDNGKEYVSDSPLTYDSLAGGLNQTGGACPADPTLPSGGDTISQPVTPNTIEFVAGSPAGTDYDPYANPGETVTAATTIQQTAETFSLTVTRTDGATPTGNSWGVHITDYTCADGRTGSTNAGVGGNWSGETASTVDLPKEYILGGTCDVTSFTLAPNTAQTWSPQVTTVVTF